MRTNQKKLFVRIITTPYRAIGKAKDFYIRSIIGCANNSNFGVAATYGNPWSRSTSTSSFASSTAAAEDLRELIRANSTARMRELDVTRADLDLYIKKHVITEQPEMGSGHVARSVSVGMGRIDEDAPVSSFPADGGDLGRKAKSGRLMFRRSRSHAVTSSSYKLNRFS